MEYLLLNLKKAYVCPKCVSDNIDKTFKNDDSDPEGVSAIEVYKNKTVSKESEDYQVHYDCLTCMDCGNTDWPCAFELIFVFHNCPKCQKNKKDQTLHQVAMLDFWTGELTLICTECKNKRDLVFSSKEQWIKIEEEQQE